jgi:hypothetical protein
MKTYTSVTSIVEKCCKLFGLSSDQKSILTDLIILRDIDIDNEQYLQSNFDRDTLVDIENNI